MSKPPGNKKQLTRAATPGTGPGGETVEVPHVSQAPGTAKTARKRKPAQSTPERILLRLSDLDAKIERLSEHSSRPVPPPPDQTELAALIEQRITGCRAEVNADNEALLTRVGEALFQQSKAITGIAEAMRALQGTVAPKPVAASVSNSVDSANSTREPIQKDQPESEGGLKQTWAEIRNAFLIDSDNAVEVIGTPESESGDVAPLLEPVAVDDPAEYHEDPDELLFEAYSHVDMFSMDEEALRRALIDQERMISLLVGRLRRKSRSMQTLTVDQLRELREGLPEALAAKVEISLNSLDQHIRLGELELSLERARVSRQVSGLEETRYRLETNAKALGLTLGADGQIEGSIERQGKTGSKGRRWLGVLGFSD